MHTHSDTLTFLVGRSVNHKDTQNETEKQQNGNAKGLKRHNLATKMAAETHKPATERGKTGCKTRRKTSKKLMQNDPKKAKLQSQNNHQEMQNDPKETENDAMM